MRFAAVLTRKWKYDESVLEYFVQTHDKVTVKRRDIEKTQWTEDMEVDEEMPEMEMMPLEPSGPGGKSTPAVPDQGDDKSKHMNSVDEAIGAAGIYIYIPCKDCN